jgi:hypothetical protein
MSLTEGYGLLLTKLEVCFMDELTKQFKLAYHVNSYTVHTMLYPLIALESIAPGYHRIWIYDLRKRFALWMN